MNRLPTSTDVACMLPRYRGFGILRARVYTGRHFVDRSISPRYRWKVKEWLPVAVHQPGGTARFGLCRNITLRREGGAAGLVLRDLTGGSARPGSTTPPRFSSRSCGSYPGSSDTVKLFVHPLRAAQLGAERALRRFETPPGQQSRMDGASP